MINNAESNDINPRTVIDNTNENSSKNDNLFAVNKPNEEEPIYIMTIELEHGKNANIKIYLDSKPEELSFEFCKENNLDFTSMNYLTKQISNLITSFANNIRDKENECIIEEEEDAHCINTIVNGQNAPSLTHNMTVPSLISSSSINCSKGKGTPVKLPGSSQKKNHQKEGRRQKQGQRQLILSSSSNVNANANANNKTDINSPLIQKKDTKSFSNSKTKSLINKPTHKLCSYDYFFNTFKAKSQQTNMTTVNKSNTITHYLLSKTNSKNEVANRIIDLDEEHDNSNANNNAIKNQINAKPLIEKSTKKRKGNAITIQQNESGGGNSVLTSSIEKNKTISSTYSQVKKKAKTNYGERLYEKCIKMKEIASQQQNLFKEKLDKEKDSIYTFKPSINSNTNDLLRERKTVSCNDDSYISNYKSIIEKHFETLKQKHPQTVYSHQPDFNKRSLQLENKKKLTSTQRIARLYHNKEKSRQSLSRIEREMYEECSFVPQTTVYTPQSRSFVSYSFKNRLEHYRSQSNEKMSKLYEEVNSSKDNITGQELFRPFLYNSIGCGNGSGLGNDSLSKSRQKNGNVYRSLYSYAARYELNKSLHQDSMIKLEKNKREIRIDPHSNKILNAKKKKAFDEIYSLIDSDEDNYINIVNMDMNRLPSTITIIINPIIDEMREMNFSLDKEEFSQACMNLYDILPNNDRETLISFSKAFNDHSSLKRRKSKTSKMKDDDIFSFKPRINKNSRRIANSSYVFSHMLNLDNNDYSLVHEK